MSWRKALRKRVYEQPWLARLITRQFHRLYYYRREQTWCNTRWLGTQILKCPLDAWVLQELLQDTKPDLVIETGTYSGGSAAYLASLFDLLGTGRIVTIDPVVRPDRPLHPRITYIKGMSTDPAVIEEVAQEILPGERVLLILDSDHSAANVAAELSVYANWVTPGSYCVVEDSNINGNPVAREFGSGPIEAVRDFVASDDRFVVDRSQEKFFLTFNPDGYLKRIR